jgi:flagellar biosynthetic protein FliR
MKDFGYHFQVFLLIMIRMNTMIVVAPFFSSEIIPFRLKALLSFLITLIIFPMVASRGYDITGNTGVYYMMVIREVFIGLYIGFLVSLMFSAFQLAGQYFSVQTGFGINEVLDPLSQISMPLIGQLKNLVGLLVFLSMNGHHLLIDGIYRSYELVPLVNTGRPAMGKLVEYMMYCFNGMFVVALKNSPSCNGHTVSHNGSHGRSVQGGTADEYNDDGISCEYSGLYWNNVHDNASDSQDHERFPGEDLRLHIKDDASLAALKGLQGIYERVSGNILSRQTGDRGISLRPSALRGRG